MEEHIEKEIVAKYINGISLVALAEEYDENYLNIKNILLLKGIALRTRSEITRTYMRKNIPLSPETIQCIEGELLGDGSIHRGKFQSYFSFRTADFNFAEWLSYIFINSNIPLQKAGIGTEYHISFNTECVAYYFRTVSTVQLHEIYHRWYDENGKKHVPEDLEITPLCVLHWWVGDGSRRGQSSGILCTDCFPLEEQTILSQKLNSAIGINTYVVRAGKHYRIYIPATSMFKFLEYIGPAPFVSMKYKWDVCLPGKVMKLIEISPEKFKKLYIDENKTAKEMAEILGCTRGTIYSKALSIGIKKCPKKCPKSLAPNPEVIDKVICLFKNHNITEISSMTGIGRKAVRGIIIKSGLLYNRRASFWAKKEEANDEN